MRNFLSDFKAKAKSLKKEVSVVFLAFRHRKTPAIAKVLAALTLAYALSPIDLIPDFIPVLGLLDDLVLVPILIKITLSLIPGSVLEEIRQSEQLKVQLRKKWWFALPVILFYGAIVYFSLKYCTSIV